jgi:hypothetical protein
MLAAAAAAIDEAVLNSIPSGPGLDRRPKGLPERHGSACRGEAAHLSSVDSYNPQENQGLSGIASPVMVFKAGSSESVR